VTTSVRDPYVAFCDGVRELCGVDLSQYKRGQMERRIGEFARRRGVGALVDYLRLLRNHEDELEKFLDRMTINVSSLWRNADHWEALKSTVLPELMEGGSLKVLSAGCSYGAEAYTIAAIAREVSSRVRVNIEGVDIDKRMLDRARAGVFSDDDARDAPRASLERWFDHVEGAWTAKAELKTGMTFRWGDLLRTSFPRGGYDLVACRNTVIYFSDEPRDALHARLAESLRPGGYLMVGATERVASPAAVGLEPAFSFVYRKVA
jgi:chemotaxis protein methyltransferase CheR